MEIISNPTQDEIKKAAQALKDGHLVAFPTETVYGLGADAINEKAIGRVYSVKARPTNHPLIVHISSINHLGKWAIEIPEYAIKLAEEFWPGPITLILKRSGLAKDFVTGFQDYVGVRVPSHPIAFELLNEFEKLGGKGIAAPSANRFGAVSPTSACAVHEELSSHLTHSDLILDSGNCEIGIESTIVDCSGSLPSILRPGLITPKMMKEVMQMNFKSKSTQLNVRTSGELSSHYSPKAEVLVTNNLEEGIGFLALKSVSTPKNTIRLGEPKNLDEFAQIFYSALRLGDHLNLQKIFVVRPAEIGIGKAINDRLSKMLGK